MSLASAGEADPTIALDPIEVTAPKLVRDQLDTPAAVAVVDEEQLQSGRQNLQLDESLNRIPGLFFQNRYNFAQNLRMSVRGFGARAPFGVRGLRLRVDGIPETLPDGQSQVDAIDLESAERVEVIRGPSSALYGNAAGGVLDVTTRSGPAELYTQGRASAGSHGFRRLGVQGGGDQGGWNHHFSFWHMVMDGYREQSETEKMMFNAKVRQRLTPGRTLTTVLTAYNQPKGQDPSGLTREQVREDRRQASQFARQLDAGQSVEQQRLGVIYSDEASLAGELTFTSFYTRRDFEQQLPFPGPSLIGFDRDFYGASVEYRDQAVFVGRDLDWVAGTEVREQRDDRERFLVDGDGNRGDQIQDALETGTSGAVFGQLDLALTERVNLAVGGRYDRVRLKVRDRRGDGEASGRETFDEFSASIGPVWRFHPRHRLYGNLGTAFETPTFTELYDPTSPDEGFDPGLEPQQALNMEVGIKGVIAENTRYDLALFRVRTDDEIIQIDDEPDRFANAGETRRDGLELGVEYFLTSTLTLSGAYTWSDFRFRDFEDEDGNNQRGNRLPGLPEHNVFAELSWRDPGGWYAAVDALVISRVYADDGNSEEVSGYGVVNFRTGWTASLGGTEVEGFWALNNVLDREYPANVRINSGDNFLEPAPERNLHAGVRLSF